MNQILHASWGRDNISWWLAPPSPIAIAHRSPLLLTTSQLGTENESFGPEGDIGHWNDLYNSTNIKIGGLDGDDSDSTDSDDSSSSEEDFNRAGNNRTSVSMYKDLYEACKGKRLGQRAGAPQIGKWNRAEALDVDSGSVVAKDKKKKNLGKNIRTDKTTTKKRRRNEHDQDATVATKKKKITKKVGKRKSKTKNKDMEGKRNKETKIKKRKKKMNKSKGKNKKNKNGIKKNKIKIKTKNKKKGKTKSKK